MIGLEAAQKAIAATDQRPGPVRRNIARRFRVTRFRMVIVDIVRDEADVGGWTAGTLNRPDRCGGLLILIERRAHGLRHL